MDKLQDKLKQREALENAYTNFVESYVNQSLEVQGTFSPIHPISPSGFYCVSAWLLVTILYCVWLKWYKMPAFSQHRFQSTQVRNSAKKASDTALT